MTRHPITRLALVLVLAAAPGCLGTRTGRPEVIGSRNVKAFTRTDRADATRWARVLIGAPKPKIRGYVRSVPVSERRDQGLLHFVYDPDFRLVGRVSPTGVTKRIDLKGREHDEGHFSLELACLLLLGAGKEEEVKLTSMPDPRG